MGEQRNLTEKNVDELKKYLQRMQRENPDLQYRFYSQDEKPNGEPRIIDVLNRLEDLERKIDHIFDGHVLIDGKFQKITIGGETK